MSLHLPGVLPNGAEVPRPDSSLTKSITKRNFERMLLDKIGGLDLTYCMLHTREREEGESTQNPKYVISHYYKDGIHYASWQSGEGWLVD